MFSMRVDLLRIVHLIGHFCFLPAIWHSQVRLSSSSIQGDASVPVVFFDKVLRCDILDLEGVLELFELLEEARFLDVLDKTLELQGF